MREKIVIVGGGRIGGGIAGICAIAGYKVCVMDTRTEALACCRERIVREMEYYENQKILTLREVEKALALIEYSEEAEFGEADLVLEAVCENLEIKKQLFRRLDALCPAQTVFITCTSSLSVTALGGITERADRVIGLHFFYPVEENPFVEVVSGMDTSVETYEEVCGFLESIGKRHGKAKDLTGFIVNRLRAVTWNESLNMVEEGYEAEAIDKAVRYGTGVKEGPIAMLDRGGANLCLEIIRELWKTFKDGKFRPCPLLERMAAGMETEKQES